MMMKFAMAAASLQLSVALLVGTPGRPASLRARAPAPLLATGDDEVGEWGLENLMGMMDDADETIADPCWHIDLKSMGSDGVASLSDVLQQAQKQGNWLRGLEGSVQVSSEDEVELLVQGPEGRLESFASWAKSELDGAAVEISVVSDDQYCSMRPLTKSFALVGEGSAFEAWQQRLDKSITEDEVSGWSEESQV